MLVAKTSGWSARRPTMVIRASVPARAADVVENARAAGRGRRRRKEDILVLCLLWTERLEEVWI